MSNDVVVDIPIEDIRAGVRAEIDSDLGGIAAQVFEKAKSSTAFRDKTGRLRQSIWIYRSKYCLLYTSSIPGKTVTNTRSTARWPRSWRLVGRRPCRKKDPEPSSHKASLTCGGTCNGGHEKESPYRTPHRAASELSLIHI